MIYRVILLAITLIPFSAFNQTVTYDDVAIIVNDNSPTSINIGNYFQSARNIPAVNVIHISCTTSESIDSIGFENVRNQIESYIITNNLNSTLNCLVTTKGVPLSVSYTACTNGWLSACASFDSEIALILGSMSSSIGQPNHVSNPFQSSAVNFKRSSNNYFLVTRLSGYTESDVIELIDRSGPGILVNNSSTNAIFDLSGSWPVPDQIWLGAQLDSGNISLQTNGWNSSLHSDSSWLLTADNVITYASINREPENKILNYSWSNGAICDVAFVHSASTFDQATNTSNSLILANLIADGVSGAHGTTHANFYSSLIDYSIVFDRYLDTNFHFNLAEAYYAGVKRLSWSDVMIGDPKTSIILDGMLSLQEPKKMDIAIYPNPSSGVITINSNGIEIISVSIFNMLGQQVKAFGGQMEVIDLTDLVSGSYLVVLSTEDQNVQKRLILLD